MQKWILWQTTLFTKNPPNIVGNYIRFHNNLTTFEFWDLKRTKTKITKLLTYNKKKWKQDFLHRTVWFIFLKTTKKNCCLFIVTLRKLAFLLGNLCLHVEPKSTLFIACLAPAMYYISHSFQDYGIAWYYLFWETWNWLKLNNASYCKPPLTWIEFENHLLH